MKIYTPTVANNYAVILACTKDGEDVQLKFNTTPMLRTWNTLAFEFENFSKGKRLVPDLWLLNGGLAIRADLREILFPIVSAKTEFLPILVSGEKWYVMNCLNATSKYDRDNSVLYRDSSKKVFMVINLVVQDPAISENEVFVIDDSNRSTLFVLPSFVERVKSLGLNGLLFREIGAIDFNVAE